MHEIKYESLNKHIQTSFKKNSDSHWQCKTKRIKWNTQNWFDAEVLEQLSSWDKLFQKFKRTRLHINNNLNKKAKYDTPRLLAPKKQPFFEKKLNGKLISFSFKFCNPWSVSQKNTLEEKVFEKMGNTANSYHSDFKTTYLTNLHITFLIDPTLRGFGGGLETGMILNDLQNAFDIINPKSCQRKLRLKGFGPMHTMVLVMVYSKVSYWYHKTSF